MPNSSDLIIPDGLKEHFQSTQFITTYQEQKTLELLIAKALVPACQKYGLYVLLAQDNLTEHEQEICIHTCSDRDLRHGLVRFSLRENGSIVFWYDPQYINGPLQLGNVQNPYLPEAMLGTLQHAVNWYLKSS